VECLILTIIFINVHCRFNVPVKIMIIARTSVRSFSARTFYLCRATIKSQVCTARTTSVA